MMEEAMSLSDSLKAMNTHAVEDLINHRLFYDLKLAAIARGYFLLTHYSDVDHDGFDVILDDHDFLRKVQVKSVCNVSATTSWEIHRGLLRPYPINFESLGFSFDCNSPQWGMEGGVVLAEYEPNQDKLNVKYFFSDIYVVTAIALDLLPERHGATKKAATKLRDDLMNGRSLEKVAMAKGLFVEAATPQHLLGLIGMHGHFHTGWVAGVRDLASEEWGIKGRIHSSALKAHRDGGVLASLRKASGQEYP
jgi:hypothetical protein